MSRHDHDFASSPTPGGTDVEPCRRRPGRLDDVHLSLIPLLRGSVTLDAGELGPVVPEDLELMEDNLAPARGIMLAILLSIPVWALMIRGAYLLLH